MLLACQFVLGFALLHNQLPAVVGDCLEDEHHGTNGDGLQRTANGLLVWRKADNFTAFTDGYRTWVDGPFGLQTRLNTERFDWEVPMGPEDWARAEVTRVLGAPPEQVALVRVDEVDWPDASLGCPQPGMMYAQVITPGYRVLLAVAGAPREVHTDRRGRAVLCP